MDAISNMIVFVKVVEKESFTAAGAALNCSTSSISKRINQLEYEVGAKLLNRSTHGVLNLTEAGKVYFERARKIIYEIEAAKESVRDIAESLSGTLRVHMTPGTGLKIALPAVLQFMERYPALSVDMSIQPESVDIRRAGHDVSIRSSALDDEELNTVGTKACMLTRAHYLIYGSESYFEKHGRPSHPRDLVNHNCLISVRQQSPNQWWFRSGGKKFSVNVKGSLVADNWSVIYDAARCGLGIARILQTDGSLDVFEHMETLFDDMTVNDRAIWALVPNVDPLPRKISVFVDFLSKHLNRRNAGAAARRTH